MCGKPRGTTFAKAGANDAVRCNSVGVGVVQFLMATEDLLRGHPLKIRLEVLQSQQDSGH